MRSPIGRFSTRCSTRRRGRVGFVPSRRRRRHRELAARGAGEASPTGRPRGSAAGARAHERPGHWRGPACGRWLSRSDRRRPPPRNSPPMREGEGGGARLKTLLDRCQRSSTFAAPARAPPRSANWRNLRCCRRRRADRRQRITPPRSRSVQGRATCNGNVQRDVAVVEVAGSCFPLRRLPHARGVRRTPARRS